MSMFKWFKLLFAPAMTYVGRKGCFSLRATV
jgi:hypothetical protein